VLDLNERTGALRPQGALPSLLLMPPDLSPIGLRVRQLPRGYAPVNVVKIDRPLRADWNITGMDEDGWVRAGRKPTVRIFRPAGDRRACATLTVAGPPGFRGRRPYVVRGGGQTLRGGLRDQEVRDLVLRLPRRSGRPYVDFRLSAPGGIPYPDGRKVAVRMQALRLGRC
jgi:hypothetical protein